MSRLVIPTNSEAQNVVEGLYKDLERRIIASPPGLCPVDLTAAFLKMCHAQTCGKCVPCRIGLAQLSNLLEDILNGKGTMKHLTMLQETARVIESTADCAIGYTAAQMVLKGLDGFKEDFMEHILHNRCRSNLDQPVPCVALCPAGVDIDCRRPLCRRRPPDPQGQPIPNRLCAGMRAPMRVPLPPQHAG